MNEREEMALIYAQEGLFVVPLSPGKKYLEGQTPSEIGFDWYSDTPPTADDIHRWFEVVPDLNIGIRMDGSGLTVVDVDKLEKWEAWANQHEPFFPVPCVKTPHGKHYYFRVTEGDITGAVWSPDGFYVADFMTPKPPEWKEYHKPYVVAPPLVNFEGEKYLWIVPREKLGKTVPDWIREAVRVPEEPHSWYEYEDDYEDDYDDQCWTCSVCGGEFWNGGTSCTCPPYGDPEPDPEREALENLVQELFDKRFPPGSDGPPDNFDWADLYQEADEELTRRAVEDGLTFDDFDPGSSIEVDDDADPFVPPF